MSVGNPWSFFTNNSVISLKDATERRVQVEKNMTQFPNIRYTIVDGVDGRKNPHLRPSYQARGIIDEFKHSEGLLGNIASHRMLWERALYECDSTKPTWTLIFEDDVKFHPLLTESLLQEYLNAIPPTAQLIRFGFLATKPFYNKYVPVNRHWMSFQSSPSFCAVSYAVRSDYLPLLLAHKWTTPIDHVGFPNSYGAANLEEVLDLPEESYRPFRTFYNSFIDATELFHGVVACEDFASQTFVPTVPTRHLV